MFILTCGIIIILYIFLSGGFWDACASKRKMNDDSHLDSEGGRVEGFFGYCGRYIGGMFKVSALMIPLYFSAFLLWVIFIAY